MKKKINTSNLTDEQITALEKAERAERLRTKKELGRKTPKNIKQVKRAQAYNKLFGGQG